MSEKKIAIIHCGFHKTASSSIQHTLAKNRELLVENGWLYPEFSVAGKSFYNQSIPLYGYYCEQPEKFKHYWYHNQVKHDVVNKLIYSTLSDFVWHQPRILFSDEFISRLNLRGLSALKKDLKNNGYEIRAISFVREPIDHIVSVTQQQARAGSVSTALKSGRPQMEVEKIKKLREVFGDSAEFYNFERTCSHNAGPAGFFFALLGLTLEPQQTVRVNEGMSLQAVRLVSYINSKAPLFFDSNSLHPLRARYDIALLTQLPGDKYQLTEEQIAKIKPETDQARSEIQGLLGGDFFSKTRLYPEPVFVWGDLQFDFLEAIFDELDLYILLRICDFLLELKEAEWIDDKRRWQFIVMARRRIDAECNKDHSNNALFPKQYVFLAGKFKNILGLARHAKLFYQNKKNRFTYRP